MRIILRFPRSVFFITFALIWTMTEAVLSLIELKLSPWIPRTILVLTFTISLIIYLQSKSVERRGTKRLHGKKLIKQTRKAIKLGLEYLQSENKNIHGQRYRHTPSLIESSTVVGAIYLASESLKKRNKVNLRTVTWLTNSLKRALIRNETVRYFDCHRCERKEACNVKYFDFLSHYYYAKGTALGDQLISGFSFLSDILDRKYIDKMLHGGWPLFDGQDVLDPLSTATNLILLSLYPSFSTEKQHKSINFLLHSQITDGNLKGSWSRINISTERIACAQDFRLVTTHRAIEAMVIFDSIFPDLKTQIGHAVKQAVEFLDNSSLLEKPVTYEYNIGIEDPEALRGIGHIVQAFTKAIQCVDTTASLDDLINYVINSQNRDGSFIGTASILFPDRDLSAHTDLTAFMTRTLCLYYKTKGR